MEHIYNCLEDGENVVSIFSELSNAIDSLDHEFILHKLILDFGGPTLCRLGSYLKGIHQFLEV